MSSREISISGLGHDPSSKVHIPLNGRSGSNIFDRKTNNSMMTSQKTYKNVETSFMEVIEEDHDEPESEVVQ